MSLDFRLHKLPWKSQLCTVKWQGECVALSAHQGRPPSHSGSFRIKFPLHRRPKPKPALTRVMLETITNPPNHININTMSPACSAAEKDCSRKRFLQSLKTEKETHHFFDFNLGAGLRGMRKRALMGCMSHRAAICKERH